MRLPDSAHADRPWRIHDLAPDFRVEDVWALPAHGGPDDFPRLVHLLTHYDTSRSASAATRALFAIRWKLGDLLGWDGPGAGAWTPTLRDRLPADLRDRPTAACSDGFPFTPLYLTDNEWAAEIANGTVHGILHLGWVPDAAGDHCGQMAVLVKPKGLLGSAYLGAIRPFRYLIVYPAIMRDLDRKWRAATGPG